MISDKQARAIVMIDAAGGYINIAVARKKLWFDAAVAPCWPTLIEQEFVSNNGVDEEFLLRDKGRDAYAEWYRERGFNMDAQVEIWRDYAVVE